MPGGKTDTSKTLNVKLIVPQIMELMGIRRLIMLDRTEGERLLQ